MHRRSATRYAFDKCSGACGSYGSWFSSACFVSCARDTNPRKGVAMIDTQFVERMANYNRWQNQNLYGCADRLSEEDRKRECGAFFGSIHGTLNHLLWADRIWMHRFVGTEKPAGGIKESTVHHPDWRDLKRQRENFDAVILGRAQVLDPHWLEGELTWFSGAAQKEITRP